MLELNFNPFPQLNTQRLVLRRIEQADAPAFFMLRSDDAVLRYLGKEPQKSISEAEEMIRQFEKNILENENLMWGIVLKEHPATLIGTICLWNFVRENYRAEIGYILNPAYWRRGIMKEAIGCVSEYGFNQLGLHSIEAQLSPGNAGSVAVLESCGFVKEGHLKENFYFRGRFSDTLIYSKLRLVK